MQQIRQALILSAWLTIGLGGSLVRAAPSDVGAEVFADVAAVEADHPFTLAVVLTPTPGWHIYWRNPGDGGLPTKITWTLPEGYTAAPIQFPLPEKLLLPGGILNYGYTGATGFLATITPPHHVSADDLASFKANVSWLSCQTECVPGRKTLEISLPSGTSTPANADLFKKLRALTPAENPPADLLTVQSEPAAVSNTETTLHLELQWKQTPQEVHAFPLNVEGLAVGEMNVESKGANTKITCTARVLSGQTIKSRQLPLLISFTDAAGLKRGFYTAIDLRAPAGSP